VRLDKAAQKEIQDIARAIGGQLEAQLPNVFAQIDWRNGLFM
jgi:thymidylate synthase ThyX